MIQWSWGRGRGDRFPDSFPPTVAKGFPNGVREDSRDRLGAEQSQEFETELWMDYTIGWDGGN